VQWLKQYGYNAKTSIVVLARCSCIVSKPRRPQMAAPASVTAAKTMMPALSLSAESALATFRSFDDLSAPSLGPKSPVPFLGLTRHAETPSMVEIAGRCCDTCRIDVAKLGGLVGDFTRIARSLESVSQHRLAGVDIGWSQPPGVAPSTPHRERRQHHWLPVADSDDD